MTSPPNAPLCPVHQTPMRFGRGSFFCPRKVDEDGEGNAIFCDQKVKRSPQAAAPRSPRPSGESAPSDHAAALSFAGSVYQSTGDAESALTLARLALEWIQQDRKQGP